MRAARAMIGLVGLAAVLVGLAVALRSFVLVVCALALFVAALVVIVALTIPSLRYRQAVKYDHSFLTNILGETSTPHRHAPTERPERPE